MRRFYLFLINLTTRTVVDAAAFVASTHKNNNKRNKNTGAVFVVVAPQPSSSSSSASPVSHSGIHYNSVVDAIDELLPLQGLDQRIALSRKDGYWPYISTGDEPPKEFVYGEFDVTLLARALDRASELLSLPGSFPEDEIVFCDLGSGTGRLVLATAALHPTWKLCRGIELLPGIHAQALENVEACRRTRNDDSSSATVHNKINYVQQESSPPQQQKAQTEYWKQFQQYSPSDNGLNQLSQKKLFDEDDDLARNDNDDEANDNGMEESSSDLMAQDAEEAEYYALMTPNNQQDEELRLAPIQLTCGSFDDPYESFFGDANVVFCFSSAMPYHVMVNLARAVGRQCLPGTLVITTEYKLPLGGILEALPDDPENLPHGEYQLELVETMTGLCTAVGGESLVYIHRVVRSIGTAIPLIKPKLPGSEIAFDVTQELEAN